MNPLRYHLIEESSPDLVSGIGELNRRARCEKKVRATEALVIAGALFVLLFLADLCVRLLMQALSF